jgi:predicted phage-related endonuclease
MNATPAVIHSAREAWLLRRRELVTASDVAAILGLDDRRRPADVFAAKLGLCDDEMSWPMRWGTAIQGAIGSAYSEATGRRVRMIPTDLPELTLHPDLSWLGASLDGDVDGCERMPAPAEGQGVFEAKATSVGHTWGDEVPVPFQLQVTVQAACAGRAWGSVGAFVGMRQPPRVQDIVFDAELFALMVPKLEEFWQRVRRKDPPLDAPEWFSHDAIRKLWSTNTGQIIALQADEDLELVKEWREQKSVKAAAEDRVESLGDRLRLRLAGAAIAYLPDGSAVALSNVKEGWVEAHTKAAHTRLLDKRRK